MKTSQDGQTRLCDNGRHRRTETNWRTRSWYDLGEAGAKPQDGPVLKQRCLVGQTLVFLGAADERFSNGRNGGMLEGHDKPLQSNLQHFIHGLNKMNRKTREDFLRNVRQILLIVLRKEHCTQAHSVGGE